MERSPELEELIRDFYRMFAEGEVEWLERMTSHSEALVMIGTDPEEWWEGFDAFFPVGRQQVEETARAGVSMIPGEPKAWTEGSVGWAADRGRVRLPDGTEVPFRATWVFVRQDDGWKLVQGHTSLGVSDEETFGG